MSAPAEAVTASCGRELLAHGILGEPSPVQRQRGCLSDWRSARCASDWRRGWKMYLQNLAYQPSISQLLMTSMSLPGNYLYKWWIPIYFSTEG